MNQSQQMKRLLSSCRISRALRKQEQSKGPRSMPGPAACVSKHLQKDIESQVVLHFEWFSLDGQRSAVQFNSSLVM